MSFPRNDVINDFPGIICQKLKMQGYANYNNGLMQIHIRHDQGRKRERVYERKRE